jgi:site-specific DNA-methyltransferase (adenine-specific)
MAYYPTSKTDKWMTPPSIFDPLNEEFKFDFDPCPIDWNGDPDGLQITWGKSTFCNPPYSNVAAWIRKAHAEWELGKTVVMLINSITDTKAFHDYIYGQAELRFIKGRIKFIQEGVKPAPNVKPSMLVIFRGS